MASKRRGEVVRPVLRLRAHHLLCALGFRGMGYSADFVRNMGRIFRRLRADRDTPLEILAGADDICLACPHLSPAGCRRRRRSAGSVPRRDLAVLRSLGLEAGARLTASEAYALVREKILPEAMAAELCAGCSWWDYGYCAEGLERLRQGRWLAAPRRPRRVVRTLHGGRDERLR